MTISRVLIRKSSKVRRNNSETFMWYALIAVPILGFLVFTLYPMLWAIAKAWYYYTGSEAGQIYVGWDNFKTLFTNDNTYWNSWMVTLKFALAKLPVELPFAMFLAVLLNKKIKGAGFFRSLYYMPNIISISVVGVIFSSMFDYFGFINGILTKFNLISENINWYDEQGKSLFTLVVASTWSSFGVNVMYFLAAMQNISEELYECAELEGAGKWTVFFRITLPLMGPVLQTILLLSINGTLHVNDLILVTTNGAPAGETYSVMAYVTSKFIPGFANGEVNIGYGCATALVTSVIFILIGLSYTKLSKKLADVY